MTADYAWAISGSSSSRAAGSPGATDTRARILHATLRVIAAGGIAAVSNRRVATEAGVALGSLTYHFPNQTDLLHDTLLLYADEEVARMEGLATAMRASARGGVKLTDEQVAAFVEHMAAQDSGRPEEIAELELHLHASRDPRMQEASRRCFDAFERFAAVILQVLDVPQPERHARAVVAVMVGLGVRRLGTGEHHAPGTADALMTVVRGARGG
ncbi:MAG TPA: TetR family transcriptional regulator [Conexibacter sp.]|nr:TetR family transcriptional regulator [Conexibacter sp.]